MMISDSDIIRMNRSTFDKLVCHLSPKLLVGNKGGKMKLSIVKAAADLHKICFFSANTNRNI